ncbi:MAG: DUF5916 domain-containing protein [Gemmatimonadota bacterium]|nr:DUF5916 domain-containing protein [Gemmatimonadota bacterium]
MRSPFTTPAIAALGLALAPAALPASPIAQDGAADTLPEAPSYTIERAASEIDVDARLDEAAWEEAEEIPLKWEHFPGDNVEPPVESVCRTTYDDDALYIGCVGYDPNPDAIRAWLADRDEGFQHDHFVFVLDPFHDRRRAFQFRVTPLGVQMDAILSQNREDFSWDTIWESEGRITDEGYVVEVAIPFKSLRFPRTGDVQTWGFIFERSYPRSSRHRIASGPRDRDNTCLLCQENELTGLRGIAPGNDVEITPTVTAQRTDEREEFPAGDLEPAEEDVDAGITGQWGITPNVTLSATVNPDFSQVEADAAQLEVNTRFALFFPERRPFFLEGSDFIEVPANLIFTRTVADPNFGGKVTGKEGAHAFGAFLTEDDVNNLIFPGPRSSAQTSLDQEVTGAVARYRRDVGTSSTIGGFVTSRDAEGYSNRTGGVDGFFRFTPRWSGRVLVAGTRTDYPDELAEAFDQPPGSFTGLGYSVATEYESRHWEFELAWDDVEEDFRADFGFLPQVGFRGGRAGIERAFWSDGSADWYDRISLEAAAEWREDHDGRLLERDYTIEAGYSGPLQTSGRVWLEWGSESFAGEIFDLFEPRAFVQIRPTGWLRLNTFMGFGEEIDFANARKADEVFLSPEVGLRIGRPLELSFEHTYQRLSIDEGRVFTAHLSELRAVYHFTVRAFLRAILQYRDVDRNPDLFSREVDPETRRMFSQLLFEYKLNPQTVVFVGYSDNRAGDHAIDLTQTDRTFFLKLGYAWRL